MRTLFPYTTLFRSLAHIDLFTCRADIEPEHAITPILDALGGTVVHGQRIHRAGPYRAVPA
jgi:S-adenosylmethionine/arginine decarboxylase-like enzyme